MVRLFNVLMSLIVLVSVSRAHGESEKWDPTFGFEINFSNPTMLRDRNLSTRQKYQAIYLENILKLCRDCRLKDGTKNVYLIELSDGFWFDISLDPAVVEVRMQPMTLSELEGRKDFIQNVIYNTAIESGLSSFQIGSGHIHIGLDSTFANDTGFFRNFLVDWINHSLTTFAVFGQDTVNAPPLAVQGNGVYQQYQTVMKYFDERVLGQPSRFTPQSLTWARKIWTESRRLLSPSAVAPRIPPDLFEVRGRNRAGDIGELAEAVRYYVYYRSKKYQDLNLSHILHPKSENRTIELRGVREAANTDELVSLVRFVRARLDYIRKVDTLIAPSVQRPMPSEPAMKAFQLYAREAGVAGSDIRRLLRSPSICEDVFKN